MLEQRMLHSKWIFVGYGCRTLQWMLRFETSQTFIVSLQVCVFMPFLGALSVVGISWIGIASHSFSIIIVL